MKRKTPMQMRAAKKTAPKKEPSMAEYAKQREPSLGRAVPVKIVHEPMRELHDPESDLHTLRRAEEVKSNPSRHRAAKAHGKKKLQELKAVIGKG